VDFGVALLLIPLVPAHRSEILILQALLDAGDDGYVSGAGLAKTLGVSRVAVWQHLEKLREQGIDILSRRARGYRLGTRPESLHPALIDAHRRPAPDSPRIHFVDTTGSTNDEAARLLASGEPAPLVVLARRQEKGRGRLGRAWHSAVDGNLYASFAFRPRVAPARMQTFTLWMGVNVCALVASFCRVTPGLKWPNDLLFDGRKAGGMLTEARMDADLIHDLVFGLGLNLRPPAGGWPAEIAHRATALSEHTTVPLDPNKFAAALVGRVLDAYERFIDGSYQTSFADLWHRFDVLKNRPVTLIQGDRELRGQAMGIDDEGSLLLRLEDGRTDRFRAGEVTFSRAP
jgi:BirA family transcriptional regulator, biotin operon repressor / biotin---[acetyl-CoA-carboxylase] ligase